MAVMQITKENFEQEVVQSELPVLLDFWASWCGPCRMLAPILSQVAEDYEGKVKVGKVNVEDELDLASAFQVSSIPTLVVMKQGKVTDRSVGVLSKTQIEQLL